MSQASQDIAVAQRPVGQLEAQVGVLENEAARFANLTSKLERILRRLRGAVPPSPTVQPQNIKTAETLSTLERLVGVRERIEKEISALDAQTSELDNLL